MMKKISEHLEKHQNPIPQVAVAVTKELMVHTTKFYADSLKTFNGDSKIFKE